MNLHQTQPTSNVLFAKKTTGTANTVKPRPTSRTPSIQKATFIPLNEEQKEASRIIHATPITLLDGPAGTGKSYTAFHVAIKMLMDKQAEQIIVTRPAIASEDLGYLPGDLTEKVEGPYAAPIVNIINRMGNSTARDGTDFYNNLKASRKLEFIPMGFLRGHTFDNSIIIADEIQNATPVQVKTLLTRIGKNSKIILTGDADQSDLSRYKVPVNGLEAVRQLSNHCAHVEVVELTICERNPIITDILDAWKNIKV